MSTRRTPFGRRAVLAALLVLGACGGDEERTHVPEGAKVAFERPPVILVSLDTLRADRLGVYGGKSQASPFLDHLAESSVVFTDCISQSSNTGPSHRSLFTGQYVHRHRHSSAEYVQSPYSMASIMQAEGFETAAYTGGGFMAPQLGFGDGFQTYVCNDPGRAARYRRGFQSILPQADEWYNARLTAGEESPFFLFLHTYDIHCPYWPAKPFRDAYGGWYEGDLDLQAFCGREDFDAIFRQKPKPSQDDLNYLNSMYDAGIKMTDNMLAEFMEMLEADGVLDQCIVVITSDHGESLGVHRPYIGHNHIFEEQLRVPLIVRFPGGEFGGTVSEEPVMLIDVLPTVLDYLDIEQPRGIQGESLMPYVRGDKSFDGERFRLSEYNYRVAFRFDDEWKVSVRSMPDGGARAKLINLKEDPSEKRNYVLHNDPVKAAEYQAMLTEFVDRYTQWREETKDEDAAMKGFVIQGAVDPELAQELTELGYTGFDEEDEEEPESSPAEGR